MARPGVSRELFVYWKVDAARAAVAEAATAAMQHELHDAHPSLQACLYRRAPVDGDLVTLMETYAAPGGVTQALQADIEAAAAVHLGSWCPGKRHVEVFDRLPG